MALVTMKELLIQAKRGHYAVGGFEFWSIDSVRAILTAAEECGMPVILQAGPTELDYLGWDVAERAVTYLAGQAAVPVALHLDHSDSLEWARLALDSGFTSVMIDASHLPFAENARITREVVAMAGPYGATVESELGRLPGAEGAISVDEAEAYQTSVDEAVRFVDETGIDCLAVAVGTVHGFYRSTPRINIDRIHEISAAVTVPLVLHGGSGTPEDKLTEAIRAGISKINICTEFMDGFGRGYYAVQQQEGYHPSVKGLFAPAYLSGKSVVKSKIDLFRAEG